MFNNYAKIMFFFILMMGTMITISSNSWLSAWMGLEINLLSFIPLMSDNNLMSTEASLKYFLIQAIASMILLFSIIMMFLNNMLIYLNYNFVELIMMSSLLLKMGATPFHFWFITVMEGLSWMNNLILMTWQKIAPMMLINYLLNNLNFILIISILSIIMGSLGGLNQTSLRKLMAFSSINHLGWMLCIIQNNESMWLIYFFFYSFLSFNMIFMFNNFKISYINQLFISYFNSKILKYLLFMNLLSLGGLPPFIGFIPKWLVIQYLVMNKHFMLLFIMLIMALIMLFYYLRLSFTSFMLNYYENNWKFNMNINNFINKYMLIFSLNSSFGLIMICMIYPLSF